LLELKKLVPIEAYDESVLSIRNPDVLDRIVRQDASWQDMVPPSVVETIKSEQLFGHLRLPKSQPAQAPV
jgi:hypothetical protein